MTGNGVVMAVERIGERPADCDGCDWRYWGDGGRWRLTRIAASCPAHGHSLTHEGPAS
jgi:hypothetical protein